MADRQSQSLEEEARAAGPFRRRIEEYVQAHSTRLPPLLEELVAVTKEEFGELSGMLSGHEQGLLLGMLAESLRARRILEIGTFTGFSALMMAEGLTDDGELITCDINPKSIAIARTFFERSSAGHRITIREGSALETLKTLEPGFDLVYIDADKENLMAYYEAALALLAPGGLIAVDNVLWAGGSTALEPGDERGRIIDEFNQHVSRDERVNNVILPVRAGLMIIRRASPG